MHKIVFWLWLFGGMSNAFAQLPIDSFSLVDDTAFDNLADALANPEKVQKLDLSQANLTNFPEEITKLPNLRILYLGSYTSPEGYFQKGTNKLQQIPASIAKLTYLEQLFLSGNQIEALPESIGELANLQFLSVATNKLKALPQSVGKLKKLKILVAYENRLETLPTSLRELTGLQELYLHQNQLKEFPRYICDLTNLQDLSFSGNQISEIPEDLGKLKQLKTLNIFNNTLKNLPASICELTNLQLLNASNNQLTTLPACIGKLVKLSDFDLSDNQLKDLPLSFGDLTNLEELRLASNQLRTLPTHLSGLSGLKRLIISQNRLQTLPDSIAKLQNLETLQLAHNRLASLPEALGELLQLQNLSITHNNLKSLPQSLGKMPMLKHIFVERNLLQTLPASLENSSSLRSIYISQNPLKNISHKLLQKIEGAEWLMLANLEADMREQYINPNGGVLFESLQKHYTTIPLYEARLLNYGAWWYKENKQYVHAISLGEKAHNLLTQIEKDSVKVLLRKPELQNEINDSRYKIDTNLKAIKAIKENLDLQALITRNTQIGATLLIIFVCLIAYLTYRNAQEQKSKNRIIEAERAKSEKLLLNILPKEIAQELKEKGESEVRLFPHTSIMFADVKGFSKYAGKVTPQVLVNELNLMFTQMDNYTMEHKMERIKTIGDCYMAVAGCPEANTSHPVDVCLVALKIQHWMEEEYKKRNGNFWQVRLGIHTGELVAGVVGKLKFAYDVWGGAVNTASRMESGGTVGKVNISATTYEYVKDFFDCSYGGEIEAKNIGIMKTYFVENIKAELSDNQQAVIPNQRFKDLYQARFGEPLIKVVQTK